MPGLSRDDCADGCGYLAEGKFDRAIAAFDLAIANNPKNALAIYYRATVYQKQGRIEKERGQIEKEQGRIEKEQGRIEKKATEDDREAMRDYEEAIRLHKEIAGAGKAQPNAVPLGTAELYDAYLNLARTSTRQATSTGRFAIIPMPLTLPQNAPTPIAAGWCVLRDRQIRFGHR